MPFAEWTRMDLRAEFCALALAPGANRRALCRRFGIAPTTGYKWLARYGAAGEAGLQERSRRPHVSPGRSSDETEAAVLALRRAHPAWGGRKIRKRLERAGPAPVPAASTVTAILRRHGALDGPGAGEARGFERFAQAAPNALWQMDFKGHVALARGRCHPLTLVDDHSRYALAIEACADERAATVRERLAGVFRRYGLPGRILCDNGPPWGTAGSGPGPTGLEVWLMDLGVGLVHGRAYHPQTQGKVERFHRSLKAEVLAGRLFADLSAIGAALERWRGVYNRVRPHEALGEAVPAGLYQPSPRALPDAVPPPDYESGAVVRQVQAGGWISWRGRRLACSKALAGRPVALRPTATDGVLELCYRTFVLAQVDLRQPSQPVHHVPEQVSTLSPV